MYFEESKRKLNLIRVIRNLCKDCEFFSDEETKPNFRKCNRRPNLIVRKDDTCKSFCKKTQEYTDVLTPNGTVQIPVETLYGCGS